MATYPTIHRNGTSRATLLDHTTNAAEAAHALIEALRWAAPNGRDYYPQGPETLRVAEQEHRARVAAVQAVLADLQDQAEHIAGIAPSKAQ